MKINQSTHITLRAPFFTMVMTLLIQLPVIPACAQEMYHSSQGVTVTTPPDPVPCLTKEMRDILKSRAMANISRMRAEGSLFTNPPQTATVTQTFAWPLTYNSNFYDNEYFYIQNYIDHDPATGPLQDYNCGDRTYDKPSGYDHTGTDICIGPYYWSMMDSMFVQVVSAAPGQIVDKDDNNFDRNCLFGGGNPNYVTILHSDGSFAIYYHMKSGSVTTRAINEMVEEGEYLGLVGSSGSSTNPHLHFEVQDQLYNVVDPWAGACNPGISTSLWKNQLPYYNPGILRLMTLSGPVPASNCPDPEPLTIRNHFNPGEIARFEIHLRDIIPGLMVAMTVTDPAGSQLSAVTFTNTGSFSPAGYYHSTLLLPSAAGTYKMSVNYSGKTAVHYFTVGCPGAYNLGGTSTGKKGYLSGSSITSTSMISGSLSNQIWYEAESFIRADPGFRAAAGCTFTARINDCMAGGVRESENGGNLSTLPATLQALPTLADRESRIEFHLPAGESVTISIYDISGRLVRQVLEENYFPEGTHQVNVSTETLTVGVYQVKLSSPSGSISCTLVVKH